MFAGAVGAGLGQYDVRLWNFGAAGMFFVFAALQLNDPDPVYWIVAYGGTGTVALAQGLSRHSRFWTGACVGAVVAGVISSAPGFADYLMSGRPGSILDDMASAEYVEGAREFLGLALALSVLAAYAIKRPGRRG